MLIDVVLGSPGFRLTCESPAQASDGSRLLALLMDFCQHAVAVQMSAYSRKELAEQGYQIEAKHFLQKPFSHATLRGLVQGLMPDLKLLKNPIVPCTEVTWYG